MAEVHGPGPAGGRRDEKPGIFGGHKRAESLLQENSELARENERLRQQVTALLGMSTDELAVEADHARQQVNARVEQARAELASAEQHAAQARKIRDTAVAEADAAVRNLNAIRAQVIATDEVAALQEVGIYEYRHPLQDAVAYKSRLADIKDQMKAMVTAQTAVRSATTWTVNGSMQKGTAMIREVSKLMLRAYNAEADNCVRTLRPHTLQSATIRLGKARDTIARLGKTMSIQISEDYHRKRVLELELTADYLVKQDEERERIRAERERQRPPGQLPGQLPGAAANLQHGAAGADRGIRHNGVGNLGWITLAGGVIQIRDRVEKDAPLLPRPALLLRLGDHHYSLTQALHASEPTPPRHHLRHRSVHSSAA
jgi:hypothetical protein